MVYKTIEDILNASNLDEILKIRAENINIQDVRTKLSTALKKIKIKNIKEEKTNGTTN